MIDRNIFTDKTAVESFYKSFLPNEVSSFFHDTNNKLKDRFREQSVELIPLGSVRGKWAVRKAMGIKPFYNDIDCGVIFESNKNISVHKEITGFVNSCFEGSGFELCKLVNPDTFYFDISYMQVLSGSVFGRAKDFLKTGNFSIFGSNLLPFLSDNEQLKHDYRELLKDKYSEEQYLTINNAINFGIKLAKQVGPKHLTILPEGSITLKEERRLKRLSSRLNLLKERFNEKNI